MAVIREQDLHKGHDAFAQWLQTSHRMIADNIPANTDAARDFRLEFSPRLPRQLWAMAVRYSLHLLVWMRLATGITSWAEEKEAGRITAVGERDDLSSLLPLV